MLCIQLYAPTFLQFLHENFSLNWRYFLIFLCCKSYKEEKKEGNENIYVLMLLMVQSVCMQGEKKGTLKFLLVNSPFLPCFACFPSLFSIPMALYNSLLNQLQPTTTTSYFVHPNPITWELLSARQEGRRLYSTFISLLFSFAALLMHARKRLLNSGTHSLRAFPLLSSTQSCKLQQQNQQLCVQQSPALPSFPLLHILYPHIKYKLERDRE